MNKWFICFILFASSFIIVACSKSDAADEDNLIRVGVRSSELRTWEYLEERAKEEGINLEIVHFNSAYDPNDALLDNEIDVNAFQHIVYLDTFIEKTGGNIVPIGATIIAPIALYSDEYESIDSIPDGSQIAIPNDASNWGRSLLLLQEAGLLTVVGNFDGLGGNDKVKEGPKNLELIPMDSFSTPRALEDTSAAIIGNGIAVEAGYKLTDSIYHESKTALPYVNIIATKEENKDDPLYKELVKLYQSEETKQFIEERYDGNYIPTFISLDELASYKKTYSQTE